MGDKKYMDDADLARKLFGDSPYGGGWTGPSIIDQYRNASNSLGVLNGIPIGEEGGISQEQYDKYSSFIKGQQGQAVAGGVMAGLGGLTNIASTAVNLGGINDTSQYQNEINDMARIGSTDYNSYDQLAMDYGRLRNSQPDFSYQDIRGKTDLEKAGGVLSAGLAGANAGMQIGGPWGALVGGAIGLGGGAIGWLTGDELARNEKSKLRVNADLANTSAQMNLEAAGERMQDREHRYQMQNVVADGGPIERKHSSYASSRMRKPRQKEETPSSRITRQYCNGGVKIRIKR
jgi:hypothetical protein